MKEIQEEYLKKTQDAAEEIFEKNHKEVIGYLNQTNARVDVITDYHKVQKEMFDSLTAQNQQSIDLYNEVKKVFAEESENFFAERLRWKTDVK